MIGTERVIARHRERLLFRNVGFWVVVLSAMNTRSAATQAAHPFGADQPKSPGVHGRVLDADARPAAKVRVFYAVRPEYGARWGQVVAETATDDAGRFSIPWPANKELSRFPDTVWAFCTGSVLAGKHIPNHRPKDLVEVQLAIDRPAHTIIDVRSPDGLPVAGATIKPRVLADASISVPDQLAELIAAETVTDTFGRAVMTALHPEDVNTLFVTAKGYGSQQFGSPRSDVISGSRSINLLPVGHVKGKVVGPVDAVKGQRLTVGTNSATHPAPYPGLAEATIDDEGRFEVRDIAIGNLRLQFDADFRSPWILRTEGQPTIDVGKTTEVEVTLEPLVPVTGVVRDKESGKLLAGVPVSTLQYPSVLTDTEGRFHIHMPVGRGTLIIAPMPDEYALPRQFAHNVTIAKREPEFELPMIELLPARILKGKVVDDQGDPVAGAVISYFSYLSSSPANSRDTKLFYRSDSQGRFEIPHVPGGLNGEINAYYRGLGLLKPLDGELDTNKELVLRLDRARQTRLTGRVLDEKGRPVVGASVRIRHQRRYNAGGQIDREEVVDLYGEPSIVTDKDGRFTTPKFLDKNEEYAAYVTFMGLATTRTEWRYASAGAFADLVLAPEPEPAHASK